MRELKVRNAYQLTINTEDSEVYIHNDDFFLGGVLVECYLKAEADAVIAHQKYKRCMAMAMWCSAELGMLVSTWEFKIKHYKKWQKRWLKIAEKFNEEK